MSQDKLGVSGLFKVLEASEALIALRRSPPQQQGDADAKEGGKGGDQALEKVLARLTQFNLGGEGTVNLSLLSGHANVLDRELQQRLGYTVPEAKGEVGYTHILVVAYPTRAPHVARLQEYGITPNRNENDPTSTRCSRGVQAFAVQEKRRDTAKRVLSLVALAVSLAPVIGAAIDMYLGGRK